MREKKKKKIKKKRKKSRRFFSGRKNIDSWDEKLPEKLPEKLDFALSEIQYLRFRGKKGTKKENTRERKKENKKERECLRIPNLMGCIKN